MTEPTHWFQELARHMGPAYDRYSFTKGTDQEVSALIELLAMEPGMRVLDVGCGTGRHARAFAERGFRVTGIDISPDFIDVAAHEAPAGADFEVADARDLRFDADFDVVISLCQGAFGLTGGAGAHDRLPVRELDEDVLEGVARSLRPGGRAAVSAFSAYFVMRYLEDHDTFDADLGVNHERTEVRNEAGEARPADLWTTCFTPRELRLLARSVGLTPLAVHGITPGDYAARPPSIDRPEFLLLARRP